MFGVSRLRRFDIYIAFIEPQPNIFEPATRCGVVVRVKVENILKVCRDVPGLVVRLNRLAEPHRVPRPITEPI